MFLCVILIVSPCFSQISPGKLSKHHTDLEGLTNCTKCHDLGKEVSSIKCLDCHTAIQKRLDESKGYHNSEEVSSKNCFNCHLEHNGREYDLIYWEEGRDRFNHDLSRYKLEGVHKRTDCRRCHKREFTGSEIIDYKSVNPDNTYLGLKQDCLSCHADEHRDQLPITCLNCHTFEGWKQVDNFLHQQTNYPLTGRHVEIECSKCHRLSESNILPAEHLIQKKTNQGYYSLYTGLPYRNCNSCHDDPHDGRLGNRCQVCHSTDGFDSALGGDFDHTRTEFLLQGEHKKVECSKCHTTGKRTEPVPHEKCLDCHTDYHQGQIIRITKGEDCSECHTVGGFSPSVYGLSEHDSSRYPLTGSHLAVPCIECHRIRLTDLEAKERVSYNKVQRFRIERTNCAECHGDVHNGELDYWIKKDGCEYCHTTESWHIVNFDHRLSIFELSGKHVNTECSECHYVADNNDVKNEMRMKPLPVKCHECHTDIHYGQFNQESNYTICSNCHSPEGWGILRFDHNSKSRFQLDGAHQRLACRACHTKHTRAGGETFTQYKPLGTQCIDCHGNEMQLDRMNEIKDENE